jgi:hypothetical protein
MIAVPQKGDAWIIAQLEQARVLNRNNDNPNQKLGRMFFDFDGSHSHRRARSEGGMNNDQIKRMVDRFLGWKLPENFSPDGGISFKRLGNIGTPHEYRHDPVGTNLFDATQAYAMVQYMVDGVDHAPASDDGDLKFEPVNMGQALGVLADIVATYVSTVKTPAIEDQKKSIAALGDSFPAQPADAREAQRGNGKPARHHRHRTTRGGQGRTAS